MPAKKAAKKTATKKTVKKAAKPKAATVEKKAAHAPDKASTAKKSGKGVWVVALLMFAVVGGLVLQTTWLAKKQAALEFDLVRVGRIISQGEDKNQARSPVNLQGDKDDNVFYITGAGAQKIMLKKFDAGNNEVVLFEPKEAKQVIATPIDIDVDSQGKVYLLEAGGQVKIFSNDLVWERAFETRVPGPSAVGVMPDGRVLVSSKDTHRVVVFDNTGAKLLEFGAPGTGSGDLANPIRMRVGKDGDVAVLEITENGMRLKVFTSSFKLAQTVLIDRLKFAEPLKLGINGNNILVMNDHIGENAVFFFNLAGEFTGKSKGTKDNQFFISPGSGGANKYTDSFYVHTIPGLIKGAIVAEQAK